ncbi:hypothetical protein RHMOL_Rhmol03G0104400 [Rhododendron molle]|uniref:Uncharacterized protein n=2 Tax=Rhododendron molle TaxID=49168 RepID=A0ACC0PEZ8_RHOML|nr:hypothetical protein RHMOL_Rhmol03G0104400 [Rhododendron molle]KAI8563339.1 hypothetical protein RHMOL_Rhmol03G0104400 [Rhododendron molle]
MVLLSFLILALTNFIILDIFGSVFTLGLGFPQPPARPFLCDLATEYRLQKYSSRGRVYNAQRELPDLRNTTAASSSSRRPTNLFYNCGEKGFLARENQAKNVETSLGRRFATVAHDSIPSFFFLEQRVLRRQLYLAPLPQRTLPRNLQNDSSPRFSLLIDAFTGYLLNYLGSWRCSHRSLDAFDHKGFQKVSPPSPFEIVKGALDSRGPILKRAYGDEEISLQVMRLANIIRGGGDEDGEDGINQLFLHVDISKPGQKDSLHFLCGLYPDALGIHSVSLRPKVDTSGFLVAPIKYNGPAFQDLDEKMRDALHSYIEERGISESLFPFLQAWLYVKDHRNLLRWFKTVGNLINERKQASDA